jgi:DNA segregation ATPase FtsK/SpoIIIE-like protein
VDQSADVIPYIEAARAEVKNRWAMLFRLNVSTWGRMPNAGPRILIVIDEYAALVDNLEMREKRQLQSSVKNLSRQARKAGVHLVLGVQNPTKDSIHPSIKRNMLAVMFRTSDPGASIAVLGSAGADRLTGHQFMARDLGGEIVGY